MQSNAQRLGAFSQNGFAFSTQLSQNQVTYLAGCHETSVAYPLVMSDNRKWRKGLTKD